MRRFVVPGAIVHFARPSEPRYWPRAHHAHDGPGAKVRRDDEGVDHVRLQPRFAKPLHPPRNFSEAPSLFLAVTRDALRLPAERLPSTPLSASAAHLRALDTIDVAVLGVSRAKHHRYLLSDAAANGLLFQAANGDCIGYVYVIDGHVGPLAISKQEAAGAALATALAFAADAGAARVSAFIPGSCHGALILALASGMRITFPMLLMADRDFGDWSRYMPRNPGFM